MPDPYVLPLSGLKVDETISRTAFSDITVTDLLTYLNTLSTLPDETVVFRTSGRQIIGDSPVRQFICKTGTHTDNGGTIRTISGNNYIQMVYWDGNIKDFDTKAEAEAAFADNVYLATTETLNNLVAPTINGGVPALRETTPSTDQVAIINANGDAVGSGLTKQQLFDFQGAADTNLSNVANNSVTYDLLSTQLKSSLGGGLNPENFLGAITTTTHVFPDPTANSGKWYFIDGIAGGLTGANHPSGLAEDGGFVFSDGTNWLLRGAAPTTIVDNAVTFPKLEEDVRRRINTFNGRAFVWGVADQNDRTPLYLKPTGKLVFDPEDNTITAGAFADGAVTAGKLGPAAVTAGNVGSSAVTSGTIASDVVTYSNLTADVQRRVQDLSNRSAVWAITDDTGRAPLFLGADGLLNCSLDNNAVKRNSIEADAIDGTKIEDLAVNTEHLAANSVIGDKILNGTITQDKLGFTITASGVVEPIDSVTITKSKETSLYADDQNGNVVQERAQQVDWKPLPEYTAPNFTIKNTVETSITPRDLLVRKKNAQPVGHYYMGDWNSTSAVNNTTNRWANSVGALPHPTNGSSSAATGVGSTWRSGFWWRIKNTVTIEGVTYNADDILVYRAMLVNTGTVIANPSTQLGWSVFPKTTLVRKGNTWDPNETPVNPLNNFTFEYEGECVEVNATHPGDTVYNYQKGDLVVYKPNAQSTTDQFIVRKTYDVTTISAGATVTFSGSPCDYEYRHELVTGRTGASFIFGFEYHTTSKVTLFKGADSNIKLFNEATGVTDNLAELNALSVVQNPRLSENGRYINFYSEAEQGTTNNLKLHVFDIKTRVVRIDQNRNVIIIGDSIANHFFNEVKASVQELDVENGLTGRDFLNFGKGSAHDTHSLEAFKYHLEKDTDVASRILLGVADFGVKFDRSLELFTHLVALMPAYSRRYLFCDMYQYQRLLTWTGTQFTADSTQNFVAERRYYEAFGNALEGTGNYISYHEMLKSTPEAIAYMDTVFDPQFPNTHLTQLDVVKEFNCLPWYNVKSVSASLPVDSPNDFKNKFQGYLGAGDATPSAATQDKYYYLTTTVQTRTINGTVTDLPIGSMIWYDGISGIWQVTKTSDLHPGNPARTIIGNVYKRLFSEKQWF